MVKALKLKEVFVCEVCGGLYDSALKAEQCEKEHLALAEF